MRADIRPNQHGQIGSVFSLLSTTKVPRSHTETLKPNRNRDHIIYSKWKETEKEEIYRRIWCTKARLRGGLMALHFVKCLLECCERSPASPLSFHSSMHSSFSQADECCQIKDMFLIYKKYHARKYNQPDLSVTPDENIYVQ
ncbi:hypothetical protein INR49_013865 [Caranx melampygus]|nr:hypothetical protein INR49_013865 [Caranx melampygus]